MNSPHPLLAGLATLLLSSPSYAQKTLPSAPPSTSALVAANTQFALDLFHQLNPAPTDNAFFSPYSISTALAMTWTGARGQTADQMAQALHFSGLPASSVTDAFRILQTNLNALQASGNFHLALANSLWPQQDYAFLPAFLDLAKTGFDSAVFPVDYKQNSEAVRGQINTWTSTQTNGKIPEIIPLGLLNASTRLVLVNAIYFKGSWLKQFDPDITHDDDFHLANGTVIQARMMGNYYEPGTVPYAEASVPGMQGNLQILALPYRGNAISFVILLPPAAGDLPALTASLNAANLAAWLSHLAPNLEDVELAMPKFKLSKDLSINDNLKGLGVNDAFVYGPANFSGMDGSRELYISDVLHDAYVDVNESGTEAAAATAVVMAAGAAPEPKPTITFRADHPFIFLIRDNATGSILFLGQLANPPASPEDEEKPGLAHLR